MMICLIDYSLHNYIDAVPSSIHLRYKNGDVWIDGEWLDISLSRKIKRYHTRFDSNTHNGCMQLSLAILMCYLPVDLAMLFHPMFSWSMESKRIKLPDYQGDIHIPLRIHLIEYASNNKPNNSFI